MCDYVSKEKAVETIYNLLEDADCETCEFNIEFELYSGCVECKHAIYDYTPSRTAIRQALDKITESSWIPVTEKEPEKEGIYLVTMNAHSTDFAIWNGNDWGYKDSYHNWQSCGEEVTAWQPLPPPYLGVENADGEEE